MAYQQHETSIEDSSPSELYLFKSGDQEFRFTSSDSDKTLGGIIHKSENITRSDISQTSDSFKQQLTVTFPKSNSFAHKFVRDGYEKVVTLAIYRWHTEDPSGETVVYWRGRVLAGAITGNHIDLACESVFTSIKRAGLIDKYELNCRHALYSTGCALNKAQFAHSAQIRRDGHINVKYTSTNPARPTGFFTGGIVEGTGYTRLIVNHGAANTLTLDRPIPAEFQTDNVRIYAGCDKSRSSCVNKFNNIRNYGGFPWIPTRNPFDGNGI